MSDAGKAPSAEPDGEDEEFDPGWYAIPVSHQMDDDLTIGTGFLGRSKGQVAFYTAAHVVYGRGRHAVATLGWDGWPERIGVYPSVDKPEALLAFTVYKPTSPAVIAGAFPRFSWVPEPGTPYMRDAVRFHPGGMLPLLAALQEVYEVVDLDGANHALTPDDHLTAVGFPLLAPPDVNAPQDWPYDPPSVCDGNFLRYTQGLIQADINAAKGFSGGPVFADDGRFAGMLVGGNVEPGRPYEVARLITPQMLIDLP